MIPGITRRTRRKEQNHAGRCQRALIGWWRCRPAMMTKHTWRHRGAPHAQSQLRHVKATAADSHVHESRAPPPALAPKHSSASSPPHAFWLHDDETNMASSRFSYPSESSAAASPSYSSTSARFSYATPSGLGTPTSASSFPISPRSSLPPTSAPRPFAKRASSAAHSPFGPYPGAVASGSAGAAGTPTNASSQAKGANQGGVDVYERPLGKARNSEVALSSLGFLFAEMVAYTQNRVSGITELEKRCGALSLSFFAAFEAVARSISAYCLLHLSCAAGYHC